MTKIKKHDIILSKHFILYNNVGEILFTKLKWNSIQELNNKEQECIILDKIRGILFQNWDKGEIIHTHQTNIKESKDKKKLTIFYKKTKLKYILHKNILGDYEIYNVLIEPKYILTNHVISRFFKRNELQVKFKYKEAKEILLNKFKTFIEDENNIEQITISKYNYKYFQPVLGNEIIDYTSRLFIVSKGYERIIYSFNSIYQFKLITYYIDGDLK